MCVNLRDNLCSGRCKYVFSIIFHTSFYLWPFHWNIWSIQYTSMIFNLEQNKKVNLSKILTCCISFFVSLAYQLGRNSVGKLLKCWLHFQIAETSYLHYCKNWFPKPLAAVVLETKDYDNTLYLVVSTATRTSFQYKKFQKKFR